MLPLLISPRNGVAESAGTSVYGTASPSDNLLPGTASGQFGLFFLTGRRASSPGKSSCHRRPSSEFDCGWGEGSFARTRCAMPFPGTMCKGIQGRSQGRRERRNGRIPRHHARPVHDVPLALSTQPDVCRPAGSRSGNRERQEHRRAERWKSPFPKACVWRPCSPLLSGAALVCA